MSLKLIKTLRQKFSEWPCRQNYIQHYHTAMSNGKINIPVFWYITCKETYMYHGKVLSEITQFRGGIITTCSE